MKRPRGDMSEKTGRVVDIEFIQEPKTQALLGRVKTDRAREFFFKGGHVRAEFKGGVVLDNDGLSEAIGLAVDADLVVAVESDDGNRGVVIRNSKGALVVHPVLRQAFRSQSPELISAMDALIESKPKMEIDAPDCARPDGMVSGSITRWRP